MSSSLSNLHQQPISFGEIQSVNSDAKSQDRPKPMQINPDEPSSLLKHNIHPSHIPPDQYCNEAWPIRSDGNSSGNPSEMKLNENYQTRYLILEELMQCDEFVKNEQNSEVIQLYNSLKDKIREWKTSQIQEEKMISEKCKDIASEIRQLENSVEEQRNEFQQTVYKISAHIFSAKTKQAQHYQRGNENSMQNLKKQPNSNMTKMISEVIKSQRIAKSQYSIENIKINEEIKHFQSSLLQTEDQLNGQVTSLQKFASQTMQTLNTNLLELKKSTSQRKQRLKNKIESLSLQFEALIRKQQQNGESSSRQIQAVLNDLMYKFYD